MRLGTAIDKDDVVTFDQACHDCASIKLEKIVLKASQKSQLVRYDMIGFAAFKGSYDVLFYLFDKIEKKCINYVCIEKFCGCILNSAITGLLLTPKLDDSDKRKLQQLKYVKVINFLIDSYLQFYPDNSLDDLFSYVSDEGATVPVLCIWGHSFLTDLAEFLLPIIKKIISLSSDMSQYLSCDSSNDLIKFKKSAKSLKKLLMSPIVKDKKLHSLFFSILPLCDVSVLKKMFNSTTFEKGNTPLHRAAEHGLTHVVMKMATDRELQKRFVEFSTVRNAEGLMPIHIAVKHGHVEAAKAIIEGNPACVDCFSIGSDGVQRVTPLCFAIDGLVAEDCGVAQEMVMMLLQRGANPDIHIPFFVKEQRTWNSTPRGYAMAKKVSKKFKSLLVEARRRSEEAHRVSHEAEVEQRRMADAAEQQRFAQQDQARLKEEERIRKEQEELLRCQASAEQERREKELKRLEEIRKIELDEVGVLVKEMMRVKLDDALVPHECAVDVLDTLVVVAIARSDQFYNSNRVMFDGRDPIKAIEERARDFLCVVSEALHFRAEQSGAMSECVLLKEAVAPKFVVRKITPEVEVCESSLCLTPRGTGVVVRAIGEDYVSRGQKIIFDESLRGWLHDTATIDGIEERRLTCLDRRNNDVVCCVPVARRVDDGEELDYRVQAIRDQVARQRRDQKLGDAHVVIVPDQKGINHAWTTEFILRVLLEGSTYLQLPIFDPKNADPKAKSLDKSRLLVVASLPSITYKGSLKSIPGLQSGFVTLCFSLEDGKMLHCCAQESHPREVQEHWTAGDGNKHVKYVLAPVMTTGTLDNGVLKFDVQGQQSAEEFLREMKDLYLNGYVRGDDEAKKQFNERYWQVEPGEKKSPGYFMKKK